MLARQDPHRRRHDLHVLQGDGPERRRLAHRGRPRQDGGRADREGQGHGRRARAAAGRRDRRQVRQGREPKVGAPSTRARASISRAEIVSLPRRSCPSTRSPTAGSGSTSGRARSSSSAASSAPRAVVWNGPMGVFEFSAFAKGTLPSPTSSGGRHHDHRRRRLGLGGQEAGPPTRCRTSRRAAARRAREGGSPGRRGARRGVSSRRAPRGRARAALRPPSSPGEKIRASPRRAARPRFCGVDHE